MTKIAQMAQDGLARAVNPAHTPMDGDTLFALATGELKDASLSLVGALAADVVVARDRPRRTEGSGNTRLPGRSRPPPVNLHLVVIVVYAAGLVGLGIYVSRRVRTSSDFFVAGRRLSPRLLFATLLAANIGGGSTVGAAGLGYQYGLSAWWWVGSAGLGQLILAATVGPRIWRLAKSNGFYTLGDFLDWRYSRAVRGVIAVLLWLGSLSILAGQLIGIAWILNVVTGVPKPIGCLLGGLCVTLYFSAGGLLSAVWVNVVQLTVKLAGLGLALPIALAAVGGWHGIAGAAAPQTVAGVSLHYRHRQPQGSLDTWCCSCPLSSCLRVCSRRSMARGTNQRSVLELLRTAQFCWFTRLFRCSWEWPPARLFRASKIVRWPCPRC